MWLSINMYTHTYMHIWEHAPEKAVHICQKDESRTLYTFPLKYQKDINNKMYQAKISSRKQLKYFQSLEIGNFRSKFQPTYDTILSIVQTASKTYKSRGEKQTQQKTRNDTFLKDQGWDQDEASKPRVTKYKECGSESVCFLVFCILRPHLPHPSLGPAKGDD